MATEQELNEWLATEIMGWELRGQRDAQGDTLADDYFLVNNSLAYYKENWNPLTDLEQSFEVLEEYCPDDQWWKLKARSGGRYSLHFHIQETGWGAGWHDADTKAKAVVGEIAKAENRFDEFKAVLDHDKN